MKATLDMRFLGGGGTPHMKGVWMLVRNFELTPKGDRSGRGPRFL